MLRGDRGARIPVTVRACLHPPQRPRVVGACASHGNQRMYHGDFAASSLLGFLITLAGASKLVAPREGEHPPSSSPWRYLFALSRSRVFAVTEMSAGLLFTLVPTGVPKSVLATVVAMVSAFGVVVSRASDRAGCMCFGALTPTNALGRLLLQCAVLVLAVDIAASGLTRAPTQPPSDAVLWVSIAITAVMVGFLIRAWPDAGHARQAQPGRVATAHEPLPSLPGSLTLGQAEDGATVTLSDVVPAHGPLFIVGVHSACARCKRLVPDVLGFAKGFGEQCTIVLIVNDHAMRVVDAPALLRVLVDPQESLAQRLRLDSRPYGLLINGESGGLMAPPSLGSDAIRRLFATMLNARQPPSADHA